MNFEEAKKLITEIKWTKEPMDLIFKYRDYLSQFGEETEGNKFVFDYYNKLINFIGDRMKLNRSKHGARGNKWKIYTLIDFHNYMVENQYYSSKVDNFLIKVL